MQIKDMFEKPIDRNIKGVIKVGQKDEENIYQELNEYVVTDELKKHFTKFFENYSNSVITSTDEMGVWISGFFGSGKSHFLKILSYILNSDLEIESKEYPGKIRRPIDFFKEDNKIQDPLVIANMIKSSDVSTDVILFNIDTKSSNSESEKDKILDVFVKVFNEMRGYCTEYPYLADLEKKLDKEGLYNDFKSTFESIKGVKWEDARDEFIFNSKFVVETLVKIGFMDEDSANLWKREAKGNYNITIEKFAKEVNEYCLSKGKNHHVVFLVDEVGQYIGNDGKLMLNLQSITEELGINCHGRAWVIVTSQQNIDEVIDVKGNDFSKIQGRFKTRLSLSSANVDEIIRKRLLTKNEVAYNTLKASYPQLEPILKNNFTFVDTAEMKKYANADEFVAVYPFIPYQFNLLQATLTSIREHGAIGKGIADSERSMLKLFQEAAEAWMNESDDILVPFYAFYDPLDEFLEHSHRSVISKASNNTHLIEFDINVLKTLFLIKYVKQLKATLDNITILMISKLDEDIPELRNKIIKSLVRLENETLIQKNNNIYSFLTNEEQDINREIKNEMVEVGEILNKASKVIFYDIYPEKKFRYNTKYNFAFNKAIDNMDIGFQTNDIGIRFITSFYDFNIQRSGQTTLSSESEDEKIYNALKGLSDNKNEIILYLNNDDTLFKEITESLQIEKYLTKHGTEIKTALKDAKHDELIDKNSNITILLEKALKQADIFVKGSKLNIPEKNPKDRINESFENLVTKVYHKLSYMDFSPDNSEIMAVLKDYSQQTFSTNDSKSNNALNDVDNYIKDQSNNFVKPPLKTIFARYNSAPYGFIDTDIIWILAKLFSQKRINLILNSEIITLRTNKPEEIFKFLSRKEYKEKILIDKKEETNPKKIKSAKLILKDVFNIAETSSNDELIKDKFIAQSEKKLIEINDCLTYYRDNTTYPGKAVLENARDLLIEVSSIKSIDKFFDYVFKHEYDFKDMGEDTYNVLQFFNNQKIYFDEAVNTYNLFESNKNFISDDDLTTIANQINNIINMENPYSKIKDLPQLTDDFSKRHNEIINQEKITPQNDINLELDEVLTVLNEDYEFRDELKSKYEIKFTVEFDSLTQKLNKSTKISDIHGVSIEASNLKNKYLNKIDAFKKSKESKRDSGTISITHTPTSVDIPVKVITSTSKVKIQTDDELESLLDKIRSEVKKQLKENDIVNLRF